MVPAAKDNDVGDNAVENIRPLLAAEPLKRALKLTGQALWRPVTPQCEELRCTRHEAIVESRAGGRGRPIVARGGSPVREYIVLARILRPRGTDTESQLGLLQEGPVSPIAMLDKVHPLVER